MADSSLLAGEDHESWSAQPLNGLETDRLVSQTMAGEPLAMSPLELEDLPALVEALLLAAPGPVPVSEIAAAAGCHQAVIEDTLMSFDSRPGRGWVLQRHGNGVQLATDPRFADRIRRLLGFEREARLSAAALETLAIVAYQQPIARSSIEAVRGVDSSAGLTTLLNRGLLDAHQRLDLPGQPFEYATTPVFLQHFGIRSLDELPPLAGPEGSNLADVLRDTVEESARSEPSLEMVGATVGDVLAASELPNS